MQGIRGVNWHMMLFLLFRRLGNHSHCGGGKERWWSIASLCFLVMISATELRGQGASTMGTPPPPPPRDFWVAPYGTINQTWQFCSPTQPFLTLDQARLQIRAYRAAGYNAAHQITVYIAGAKYDLADAVVFTIEDSGWVGHPIKYVAWNPGGIQGYNDDDVLFSGGRDLVGWAPSGTMLSVCGAQLNLWTCMIAPPVEDVRDVYMQRRRLVRARFPNVSEVCPHTLWTGPNSAPCAGDGFLRLYNVLRNSPGGNPVKTTVLRRYANSPAWPPEQGIDWRDVEVVAYTQYLSPRQRATANSGQISTANDEMLIDFPITQYAFANPHPGLNPPVIEMDLGALGIYKHVQPNSHSLRKVHVRGELELVGHEHHAAQVYLEGARAFLDANEEWHYDPIASTLTIALCPSHVTGPQDVVIPVLQRLLVLDRVAHVEFEGLDWAYSFFPFPKQADGITPGYAPNQAGAQWIDVVRLEHVPELLTAAVVLEGAEYCKFTACRFGHMGATAVSVGTKVSGSQYWQSNHITVSRCEMFDLGGHGILIGDNQTRISNFGAAQPGARKPNEGNIISQSKVHRFGLVYKCAAGLNLYHARNAYIGNNEIAYGNWSGMHIGNLGRSAVEPGLYSTCIIKPSGVANRIEFNKIHRACLGLIDCGGIYMAGTNRFLPASDYSTLFANYILSMQPSPYSTLTQGVNGIYWDRGANEWAVARNYVRNVYRLFHFNTRGSGPGSGPNLANAETFGGPTYPISWQQDSCPQGGGPYTWTGQFWPIGDPEMANRWFFAPDAHPSYYMRFMSFKHCWGHAALPMNNMQNVIVPAHQNDPIAIAIADQAGPAQPALWFPGTGERIYPVAGLCSRRCGTTPQPPNPGDDTEFDLWDWEWDW
jgi:hypothetical protein